jgi:Flp pilus assembly protein TadB
MTVLLSACLAVAAVAVVAPLPGRRSAGRLARLAVRPAPESAAPASVAGAAGRVPRWFPARMDTLRCAAGLGGIAVGTVVGDWFGVLAGLGAAALLDRGLRRLPPAGLRQRRLAEAAELPLAADLLAVALRGGAPVDRATAAVADALPGPLGDRLARVGRALRLGGTPAEAWAQLAPVEGADRLVRAAVRSAEHGSALAGALGRLADDLRADRAVAAEAAARRAGVLIVLPLGLCFLPAFVLAGLVPVILAILGDVL